MTLPMETEATIRRRILDICKDHARNVVDITRELALMLDSLAANKREEVKQHYDGIQKLMGEASKLKSALIAEIASLGALLISRDDFLRLMLRLTELADTAEALGYRLLSASERKLSLGQKHMERLSELLGLVLKEVSRVKETLHSLGFDRDKAIELARAVEEIERNIDTDSRNFDLDLMNEKLPVPTLLFLRDLVDRAERMADIGVDIVDEIRVLALTVLR